MPDVAKKGITVKVAAELHAEVSEYIRSHGMTMSEFVAVALDNELHPKISEKEGNIMANTRTVAFQVPEEMFQRIKDYLHRNNMTQKQFLLGLIEREQTARESENAGFERESEHVEDEPDYSEKDAVDDFEGDSDEDESEDEYAEDASEVDDEESEDEDFDDDESDDEDFEDDEAEDEGFGMSM